jgi:DNA-binding winged helix-turn-helix (wHTH) protein/Tol biopolymer transport system component
LELLDLLLVRQGKFVFKEEIFERIWPETFVEDGVLTQNIYTLRKALGKTESGGQMIENKTRLGYRLAVPVAVIERKTEFADPERGPGAEAESVAQLAEMPNHAKDEEAARSFPALLLSGRRLPVVSLAILIAALSLTGFLAWSYFRAPDRAPVESVKFSQLTNTGNLTSAALSPDGNFLAFARASRAFLKDLATAREIPLEIPNAQNFGTMRFSADGNFLYFRDNSSSYSSAKIIKTSRFGGDNSVVTENSFGGFSLSPDNKLLAYYKNEKSDVNRLTIKNLETKEERPIFETLYAGMFNAENSPVWSPDGRKILQIKQVWGGMTGQVFLIDVETGDAVELKIPRLRRFGQAAWFPDGNSFVISASEDGRYFHLWRVSNPDLNIKALTIGLTSYSYPEVSADGRKISALQTIVNSNLFIADAANLREQKPLTTGNTNRFGQMSLVWADDKRIVYGSQTENEPVENLWLIDTEGNSPKPITKEGKAAPNTPSSDGKFIYYNINRNRLPNLNQLSLNDQSVTEITGESDGARRSPQVTADGRWLYYSYFDNNGGKILRRFLSEQMEEVFLEDKSIQCGGFLTLSPDEKYLACFNSRPNQTLAGKNNNEIALIAVADKSVRFVPVEGNRIPLRFSPDSKSVDFLRNFGDGIQIMRLGLNENEPEPILSLPDEHIFSFAWSPDGRKIALSRGRQYRDAVVLTEFDK